ncbi:MAG: HPr family phosphocarrier protein [Lachnospiraceae bacterium]|nr:HPr family phosphocarrier protein [Lachnospiraceae bacterium]
MIEVHIKDPECKKGNYGFITVACGFESEIIVVTNGSKLNAKSIMNIPVFENAATLDFIVSGADEEKAVAAIRDFFQKKKPIKAGILGAGSR